MVTTSERALVVSSDGHAMPKMRQYRPYLTAALHERFDAFCDFYDDNGVPPMDPAHLRGRLDPDVVEQWVRDVFEPGRLEGCSDPVRRLAELEREGIVAEVLFPDFGMPFEAFGPPSQTMRQGASRQAPRWPARTREEIDAGNRAHNRWLVDFCSAAPDRFLGMAVVSFDDVEAALAEIRWARESGLRGVLLPTFSADQPIFHERHEPIWSLLEELEMPLNSHVAISSSLPRTAYQGIPDPVVALPLCSKEMVFRCHEVLTHLVWSGILERHPGLRVAFTEQGSAWVITALASMDYSYQGSYQRRAVRDVVRREPSEYFRRQCWLGSSIFSRAEVEARHQIGLDAMCLGMDYPHHEGTFAAGGTTEYLRATLGAAGVPADEARLLLGGNAIARWGFDHDRLRALADRFGPSLDLLLTPPDGDLFPRGDVHKPLVVI
ncbi:amidohydrolase family protein [Pseudofrankia inefficax]|uniref:Amidohydrolase 2 n=1 Tax=Pseudofrankia inefficax (strain DSM 45817 / CECT 9037 / DDB 130130 / EuI1c) TaxID=298654 RepID=E3J7T1_PSEI1|nr:amidohydrolase 2 [Pseudofrankia inefficax]